jgi:hypothetical protein
MATVSARWSAIAKLSNVGQSLVGRPKMYYLEWRPGQNKRIAPFSFLHGCRKTQLKD